MATGIFGLAQVKKILSTQFPAGGGGSGSAPSISAVSAPLQPVAPARNTTELDQKSLNALGAATTRAFVVEADVSSNQEKIRRLNRAARI